MQQTQNYKLNLIETSDPFSPAPLNENAEKLEAALATKADAAQTAALDARLRVFEARHFVFGSYTGTGAYLEDFPLGFTPKVIISKRSNETAMVAFEDDPITSGTTVIFSVVAGGFRVGQAMNTENYVYYYLAID